MPTVVRSTGVFDRLILTGSANRNDQINFGVYSENRDSDKLTRTIYFDHLNVE